MKVVHQYSFIGIKMYPECLYVLKGSISPSKLTGDVKLMNAAGMSV
jgi:hypothetical protein